MAKAKKQTQEHHDENTIYTTEHRVSCDGGGGPLGHPKTYYDLGEDGKAECLYCGQKFEAKH